uniref:ATP-dependent DNA helicase n=1 Tax=Panagrolaimus superbus TaxID=310955 RepID=A0A914YHB4_9BILA
MFCSGTAGTGKSFLIHLLANELALLYVKKEDSASTKPATLIAAPTGLAAIQINGSTIHSLLSINVQHGSEGKMKPLSKEALNLKRILFQNVKLIIIDETSMVSNIMLAKIHSRLCEFMDKNELFGGANLLFFGDLLQLPPVKSSPIFKLLQPYQLKKVFDSSVPPFSFWECFGYEELTENMRQKKSLEFAEILGRMRVEALTQADHETLRSKIIKTPNGGLPNLEQLVEKYIEVREKNPTVMALFACTDEVTMFNNEVTKQLNLML